MYLLASSVFSYRPGVQTEMCGSVNHHNLRLRSPSPLYLQGRRGATEPTLIGPKSLLLLTSRLLAEVSKLAASVQESYSEIVNFLYVDI